MEITKPHKANCLLRTLLSDGLALNDLYEAFILRRFNRYTSKNAVISSTFLEWKFCGKAQFPHSLGRFVQNNEETVPFHKIYTPGN